MTAQRLLSELNTLGVVVEADGNELVLRGKTHALTPEMVALLKSRKEALLTQLRPEIVTASSPGSAVELPSQADLALAPFADLLSAIKACDVPKGHFVLGPSPRGGLFAVTDLSVFVLHTTRRYREAHRSELLRDLHLCQNAWRRWKAEQEGTTCTE